MYLSSLDQKRTEALLNFDEHLEKTLYKDCYSVKNGLLPNKELRKKIKKIVKKNKKGFHQKTSKQLQECSSYASLGFIDKYFTLSSCLFEVD